MPSSPLTQGRGSKHKDIDDRIRSNQSPLTQGRGSKLGDVPAHRPVTHRRPSHRGVDRNNNQTLSADCIISRPSHRGVDRNLINGWRVRPQEVAPHTGAWIETGVGSPSSPGLMGRPSHRGVDRNSWALEFRQKMTSRPSHRGVDRNNALQDSLRSIASRPSHRGVDRNFAGLTMLTIEQVAPHTGAWIETCRRRQAPRKRDVAPHTGAWIETMPTPSKPQAVKVAPHTGAWIETIVRKPWEMT